MPQNIHIYGIKNCDTVRKAIKWLAEKEIESQFHDLKKETLSSSKIKEWLADVEQDKLINKRGLTWRKIPTEEKSLSSENAVIKLIKDNPTVVKRPILFNGVFWSVGFKADIWDELFL